ncbi:TIGR00300 family protein, partial [Halococcus sp. IIIV-5B]
MTVSREVELSGHIIDSGMMQSCFVAIMDLGGSFEVEEFRVGRTEVEASYARLTVLADTEEDLRSIVHELHQNGANPSHPVDASLDP